MEIVTSSPRLKKSEESVDVRERCGSLRIKAHGESEQRFLGKLLTALIYKRGALAKLAKSLDDILAQ